MIGKMGIRNFLLSVLALGLIIFSLFVLSTNDSSDKNDDITEKTDTLGLRDVVEITPTPEEMVRAHFEKYIEKREDRTIGYIVPMKSFATENEVWYYCGLEPYGFAIYYCDGENLIYHHAMFYDGAKIISSEEIEREYYYYPKSDERWKESCGVFYAIDGKYYAIDGKKLSLGRYEILLDGDTKDSEDYKIAARFAKNDAENDSLFAKCEEVAFVEEPRWDYGDEPKITPRDEIFDYIYSKKQNGICGDEKYIIPIKSIVDGKERWRLCAAEAYDDPGETVYYLFIYNGQTINIGSDIEKDIFGNEIDPEKEYYLTVSDMFYYRYCDVELSENDEVKEKVYIADDDYSTESLYLRRLHMKKKEIEYMSDISLYYFELSYTYGSPDAALIAADDLTIDFKTDI